MFFRVCSTILVFLLCFSELVAVLLTVGVASLLLINVYILPCICLDWNDWYGDSRPHFACVKFQGRLANQMFMFTFLYAIATDKELTMIIPEEDQTLTDIFDIPLGTFSRYGYHQSLCNCFPKYEDEWDCAYDSQFEKLEKHRDANFVGYFQSWKYWKHHEKQIRDYFRFRDNIKTSAQLRLRDIVQRSSSDLTRGDVLVGIHVRRGDYVEENHFVNYGYKLATKEYLENAMTYFRKRHKRVVFIACSNDIAWTRKTLSTHGDVYVVDGNTPEVDMALLTMTNHTIMTVGTFGWWIGFLTQGTTVYYRHPFVAGSDFGKQFHTSTAEHFYPGWISME